MPRSTLAVAMGLLVLFSGSAVAQSAGDAPADTELQLRGIADDEADAIVKELQKMQDQLRKGEKVYFQLISGSIASYPETAISPRQVFLDMPFETTAWFRRTSTSNPLWKPYKLDIPTAPGSLVWDIEVVIGFYGNIERVEMFFRPPHPF